MFLNRLLGARRRPLAAAAALGLSVTPALASANNFPLTDLGPYYFQVMLGTPELIAQFGATRPYLQLYKFQPNSHVVGGAPDPPGGISGLFPVMSRLVNFYYVDVNNLSVGYWMQGYRDGACTPGDRTLLIPRAPAIGSTVSQSRDWLKYSCGWGYTLPNDDRLTTIDTVTFGAPVRRQAIDGGQYDASPMPIKRDGVAWETFFWAYRLGMVASRSDWVDSNSAASATLKTYFTVPSSANNFELAALPSPHVEDVVVEYVNRVEFPAQPGGQYFYAVRDEDKRLLDSLPNWSRTGNSFPSGGYVSVCRFYGGLIGGPNTHFYSADAQECQRLKGVAQLSYEGQTFAVNMPLPPKNAAQQAPGALRDCPADSRPLYRVYNNASASGGRFVSNHRYLTDRADVIVAVEQGWVDEGHVMCVPF
ncbi:MAG: hypothetical protein IT523_00250 [Burkholderiales bacterium]|nr:hypothetical protein [Pseudomonadota bacterium]MCC7066861.1 hypothetical protein [Burkholderiales bacterium]